MYHLSLFYNSVIIKINSLG